MPIAADERSLSGPRWVRFDDYEITDDVVHPTPDAKLEWYDPWETYVATWQRQQRRIRRDDELGKPKRRKARRVPPYRELLRLAPRLQAREVSSGLPILGEVNLTPRTREQVLAWCRSNGLLGLLHQETLEICLPPVWERYEPGQGHLHAVAHAWRRSDAGWIEDRHRYPYVTEEDGSRVGEDVPATRYGDLRDREIRGPARGLRLSSDQIAAVPRALQETIGPAGGLVRQPFVGGMEVAGLKECWRGHFPTRVEWQTPRWPLPSPHSEEFWRSYGEPLAVIVDAAAQLRWILLAFQTHSPEHVRPTATQRLRLEAALDSLGALTLNAWPRAYLDDRGRPQVRWAAPSLLASFALMIMLDLAGKGMIRVCSKCGTPFVSTSRIARYCSDQCRYASDKAKYREKRSREA